MTKRSRSDVANMSLRGARRRGNLGEFRILNSEFKN